MFPTKSNITNVLWTLGALAVVYRVGGKDLPEGRSKFLGIF